jgi:hypothetical protein
VYVSVYDVLAVVSPSGESLGQLWYALQRRHAPLLDGRHRRVSLANARLDSTHKTVSTPAIRADSVRRLLELVSGAYAAAIRVVLVEHDAACIARALDEPAARCACDNSHRR